LNLLEYEVNKKLDQTEIATFKEVVALVPTHKDFDDMKQWIQQNLDLF